MNFPRTEAEIVALGHTLASGLTADASIFTDPPVAPTALNTLLIGVEDTTVCSFAGPGKDDCFHQGHSRLKSRTIVPLS